MWRALPALRASGAYSLRLPNAWNFGFDYVVFLQITLLVYPLLWWQLFSTMLRARAKKLGGGGGGGGTAAVEGGAAGPSGEEGRKQR